jgi:hypothetical protein
MAPDGSGPRTCAGQRTPRSRRFHSQAELCREQVAPQGIVESESPSRPTLWEGKRPPTLPKRHYYSYPAGGAPSSLNNAKAYGVGSAELCCEVAPPRAGAVP